MSFVLDLLWTILWLAAAGCVTSFLPDMPIETSKVRASTAFAWLSWFLWIGSTLISFQDWRGGVAGYTPGEGPGLEGAVRHKVRITNRNTGQEMEVEVPEDR